MTSSPYPPTTCGDDDIAIAVEARGVDDLFPSAIVCSCSQRFVEENGSALRRFLHHRAACLAAAKEPKKPHCAAMVMFRCVVCSLDVDINQYGAHMRVEHSADELAQCIGDYREVIAGSAKRLVAPTFECDDCLERDEFNFHDVVGLLQHSHADATTFELYLHCVECGSIVPLCDVVGHAAFWHPDQLHRTPLEALADLYQVDAIPPRAIFDDLPAAAAATSAKGFFNFQQHSVPDGRREEFVAKRRRRVSPESGNSHQVGHDLSDHCKAEPGSSEQDYYYDSVEERPARFVRGGGAAEESGAGDEEFEVIIDTEKVFGKSHGGHRCSSCAQSFSMASELELHRRVEHGSAWRGEERGNRPTIATQSRVQPVGRRLAPSSANTCSECGRRFARQHDLTLHSLFHRYDQQHHMQFPHEEPPVK